MAKKSEKHVCQMCGRTDGGSWVRCALFNGWVCDPCHARCIYLDNGTSLGGCKVRYANFAAAGKQQKNDRPGRRSEGGTNHG